MKNLLLSVIAVLGMAITGCSSTKVSPRDYAYEAYCDSIWNADKDYYLDVLCETDEYCTYIEEHGEWWD